MAGALIHMKIAVMRRAITGPKANLVFTGAVIGILLAVGDPEPLLDAAGSAGVDALSLGRAGGERLELSAAEREASVLLADAERAWTSLARRVEQAL